MHHNLRGAHPRPGFRLCYDAAAAGLDGSRPMRIGNSGTIYTDSGVERTNQ